MFIQKRWSENQNLSDTLAFQICSFYKQLLQNHKCRSISLMIHLTPFIHIPFHFIHPYFIHFIPWSTSFPSQSFKFGFFLQLNNTHHELQATFHTPLHFISCDPFYSIIHFIHIPLHHISLSIFTHSIKHSIHAPNHSISCFKSSIGTFCNQSDIL